MTAAEMQTIGAAIEVLEREKSEHILAGRIAGDLRWLLRISEPQEEPVEQLADSGLPIDQEPAIKKRGEQPSITTMERWMDTGRAKATDGCTVEPDGTCPHGCPSWLIELGMI